ncbi:UNVERIFIED_CONTAM: hypothetical protein BJ099_11570 [Lysinibacillus xylanilyticus]
MKQALLILDIQNDYLSTQARMPVAKHQIESTLNCINDLKSRMSLSSILRMNLSECNYFPTFYENSLR